MTTAPKGAWERINAHADYSNYRQFTTSGEDQMKVLKVLKVLRF